MPRELKNIFNIRVNENRIYGLDILRALAILFVMLGHGKYLLPEKLHVIHWIFVFDGVSIFFVLSGFLIGGILIKLFENNKPTKELLLKFWIRRWFRTLPNYFLILFILIGLSIILKEDFTIWSVRRYFVFAQNLFYQHPAFFPEAWSLSIEEWFYIITPAGIVLIIYALNFKPKKAVLTIAIIILLITISFRYYRYLHVEINYLRQWDELYRKQVFTRFDSLMFGVICAYIQYYHKRSWLKHKHTLMLTGILIFILTKTFVLSGYIAPGGFYNCVLSFAVTAIGTSLLLPYLSDLHSGKGLLFKGLTKISLISYSMYLLNYSIVQFFIIKKIPWYYFTENNTIITISNYIFYWGFTIIGSFLIYKYYELPVMKLRDNKNFNKTIDNLLTNQQQ